MLLKTVFGHLNGARQFFPLERNDPSVIICKARQQVAVGMQDFLALWLLSLLRNDA